MNLLDEDIYESKNEGAIINEATPEETTKILEKAKMIKVLFFMKNIGIELY